MIVRSEEQWLDLFNKHEAGGLSAAQFCRDEKLCTRYFSKRKQQLAWSAKKHIKRVKKKQPINDFIKLSVSNSNHSFSLDFKDIKLIWNELPPSQWLSDFIKAL